MRQRHTATRVAVTLAACALAATASARARQTTPAPSRAADIARIEAPRQPDADGHAGMTLQALMQELRTPGLSLAVVRNFEISWVRAYVYANVEATVPATPDTLFQAASISKPVSAMAVLKAVQDGIFDLDDNINSVLTSWQLTEKQEYLAKTPVTPRLLLSMTAGTTVSGFPGYLPTDIIPTVAEVVGRRGLDIYTPANTPPVIVDWEPNTRYEYSGGGSTILQLALADVA